MNFRESMQARRINMMRARYERALQRVAHEAAAAAACPCPICTAKRGGLPPTADARQHPLAAILLCALNAATGADPETPPDLPPGAKAH